MTHLRKMMLEELQRRNYAQSTVKRYISALRDFANHFHRPPDQLGPEHIRQFQLYLLRDRKLAANTVKQRMAAVQFFFARTLKRPYLRADFPYPKAPRRLPNILSREEVDPPDRRRQQSLASSHADDALLNRPAPLGTGPPPGQRYRQPADGDSRSSRQGQQRPRRAAQPEAAGNLTRVLALDEAEKISLPRGPGTGRAPHHQSRMARLPRSCPQGGHSEEGRTTHPPALCRIPDYAASDGRKSPQPRLNAGPARVRAAEIRYSPGGLRGC